MSRKSFLMPDELSDYADRTWLREPQILTKLRDETAAMPEGGMQISADQGQFFTVLLKAIGARRTLEVGVFTGYSSLVTALALPEDGRIVACDVSKEFTDVARRYWKEAGVDHKIELRLGPGVASLDALITEGQKFDFCFIDADKPSYPAYFERAIQLVRPNGLIAIDNVLRNGDVSNLDKNDEGIQAIRQTNELAGSDPRVESCLIPIGDGVTLARVK